MPESVFEQRFQAERAAGDAAGARVLVVAGGRLGVGATTVAIHLARELAQDAQRIVLIDAHITCPSIADRCGAMGSMGIADVLTGRKTIHEALQRGPAGMQILTGSPFSEKMDLEERSISRLLRQLRTLSPHVDWLIVDTGNQVSELAARLWSIADQLLLVTAADAVAVMDTYALVKTLHSRKALRQSPSLVVNNIDDHAVAADVHRRIDQSCRRFLDLSIAFAGALPSDPSASAADQTSKGPLATGIAGLCKQLLDSRHTDFATRSAA